MVTLLRLMVCLWINYMLQHIVLRYSCCIHSVQQTLNCHRPVGTCRTLTLWPCTVWPSGEALFIGRDTKSRNECVIMFMYTLNRVGILPLITSSSSWITLEMFRYVLHGRFPAFCLVCLNMCDCWLSSVNIQLLLSSQILVFLSPLQITLSLYRQVRFVWRLFVSKLKKEKFD